MDFRSTVFELRTLGTLDLRGRDGKVVQSVLAQPRRSALLIYLALARPRGMHQRDTLLNLFWGERDQASARKALRQALYYLRSSLGEDVIVTIGDNEVGVAGDRIRCDAVELDRALEERRIEDALALYAGELLPGFYVEDAPEFERWLDEERSALHHTIIGAACERIRALSERDPAGALRLAEKTVAVAQHDERAVTLLIRCRATCSENASAMELYEWWEATLRRDHDMAPSEELQQLAAQLRGANTGQTMRHASPPAVTGQNSEHENPALALRVSAGGRAGRRSTWLGVAAVLLAAVVYVAGSAASDGLDTMAADTQSTLLLVPEFAGHTMQPAIGNALATIVRADLERSIGVRTVGQAHVVETLRRMGREPSSQLDVSTAREIGRRLGAYAVLLGTMSAVGEGFVVSFTLVRVADGEELLTRSEHAARGAELLDAATRLTTRLTEAAGFERDASFPAEPLPQVTTHSLDALVLYQAARRVDRGGMMYAPEVVDLLEQAIAHDSTFAMAHAKLAEVLGRSGVELNRVIPAVQRAYALRASLTEPERTLAVAAFREIVERNRAAALTAYKAAVELRPHHLPARNALADALRRAGRMLEAEAVADTTIRLHPRSPMAYSDLFYAQMMMRDHDAARATIERLRRQLPAHPLVYDLEAHFGELRRDYVTTRIYMDSLRQIAPERAEIADMHDRVHAEIEGRHAEAEAGWAIDMEVASSQGDSARLLRATLRRASIRMTIDPHGARELVEPWYALALAARPSPYAQPGQLAEFAASSGQLDYALALHGRWRASPQYESPSSVAAQIAMTTGRPHNAIMELQLLEQTGMHAECPALWSFRLGQAYEAAGDIAAALRSYTTGVEAVGCGPRDLLLPHAYQRLAALHESRGDNRLAVEYYTRLVHLWRDADPILQPSVQHALGRMKQLRP